MKKKLELLFGLNKKKKIILFQYGIKLLLIRAWLTSPQYFTKFGFEIVLNINLNDLSNCLKILRSVTNTNRIHHIIHEGIRYRKSQKSFRH